MSRRSILRKQTAQLRKMLRATPAGSIDLVQWLRLHGHAQTAGEARKLIQDGRVKSESHVLGQKAIYEAPASDTRMMSHPRLYGNPRVAASLRPTLYVTKES